MVFTWAKAKNGECYVGFCCVVGFFSLSCYFCVLASSFHSQYKLPKGEMDQVAPVGVNTRAEIHSKYSLWKCTVSYWSLLRDIAHQSKWQ